MIVDIDLIRGIEAFSAQLCVDAIETMRALGHDLATWEPLDSGSLVAMGEGLYINRAVGVGFGDMSPVPLLDHIEAFYGRLGLPAAIELCPWVPADLVAELARRRYVVRSFRDVYGHDLRSLPPRPTIEIHEVGDQLERTWTDILGSEYPDGTPERRRSDDFCAVALRVPGKVDLVAVLDGAAVASGGLTIAGGFAGLGGATTLRAARGRGAQSALLAERLHRAAEQGCTVAVVTALPGGISARNIRRAGFRLLYTQAIMEHPPATAEPS